MLINKAKKLKSITSVLISGLLGLGMPFLAQAQENGGYVSASGGLGSIQKLDGIQHSLAFNLAVRACAWHQELRVWISLPLDPSRVALCTCTGPLSSSCLVRKRRCPAFTLQFHSKHSGWRSGSTTCDYHPLCRPWVHTRPMSRVNGELVPTSLGDVSWK